jgi:hypothetical protein
VLDVALPLARRPSSVAEGEEALLSDASTPDELLVTMPAVDIAEKVGLLEKVCVPVKVWAASVLAIVADVLGNVIVVESVPANVMELLNDTVLPLVMVSVPVLVVIVRLLIVPGRMKALGMESVTEPTDAEAEI